MLKRKGLLDKTVQQVGVPTVADKLSDHLLVQAGVISQPLGHLIIVHGAAEQAFLLQDLNALLGFLIKLLCTRDQKL